MDNISIHPRVVKGRTVYSKANTAARPKRPVKKASRLARRVADWDATVKSLGPKGNPMGFRKPGSMKK